MDVYSGGHNLTHYKWFLIYSELCNQYLYLVPEYFITLQETPHQLAVTPIPLFPQPLATTDLLSISMDLPILDISRK